MKNLSLLLFLLLCLLGYSYNAIADGSVHALAAHAPEQTPHSFLADHPTSLGTEILTLNPKFTIDGMQVGYGPMITTFITKYWYAQGIWTYTHKHTYGTEFLTGVTALSGHFLPYAELYTLSAYIPHTPMLSTMNYDTGINFAFGPVVPIIEFDNYFEKHRLLIIPQLSVAFTKKLSMLLEFCWAPYTGMTATTIQLTYAL